MSQRKRILKHRIAVSILTYLIKLYCNLIFLTCKIKSNIHPQSQAILESGKVSFVCLWHGRIFIFPKFMTRYGKFSAVISSHNDGEYLERFLSFFGHSGIRGSSRKQSFNAIRDTIRNLKEGKSVVITPDGPKGPRFEMKGSIARVAEKLDIPIIPVTFSSRTAKVFSSWDRFILPKPFSTIHISISEPFYPGLYEKPDETLEKAMNMQMKFLDSSAGLKVDY